MIARRPKQVARIARRERVTTEASTTLDLTVRYDPVADALDAKPDTVNPRYRTDHDAFVTMLRAASSPHGRFSVEGVLCDWWSVAFPDRPFPPREGGYANELALTVQYGLLMRGYRRYDMKPPERFKRNHDKAVALRFGDLDDRLQAVLDLEEKTALGQKFIQPKPQGAEQWRKSSARRPKSAPNPKPIARRPRSVR